MLVDGRAVPGTALDPEVLTSIDDRPGEEYRPVHLGEVPITLLSAVLAAEDHRFFEHGGLDLRGVLRAAWANWQAGRVTQGGSTITQQLVKNRLLSSRRSYLRKVREAWLAALVEWRYPKERILESYLNEHLPGPARPARRFAASARRRGRTSARKCTRSRSPRRRCWPAWRGRRTRIRRSPTPSARASAATSILARMLRAGQDRGVRVRGGPSRAAAGPGARGRPASRRRTSPTGCGRRSRTSSAATSAAAGARVFTTLDLSLQRFAESAVSRGLERLEARLPRLARKGGRAAPGRGGRPRSRDRGDPRARRRTRLPGQPVQPRGRRAPPAGLGVQAVRFAAALAERNGQPAFTAASFVDDTPITLTVRQPVLESAQLRGPLRGPGDRAAGARAVAERRHRARGPRDRAARGHRGRAAARADRRPGAVAGRRARRLRGHAAGAGPRLPAVRQRRACGRVRRRRSARSTTPTAPPWRCIARRPWRP